MADSWFTSKKIIEKSLSYGLHLIGGLKTNRCIYPQGIKIKISDFVGYIEDHDLDVVTFKGKKYKVYRYEGGINGIDNAVVLICWEANSPAGKPTCIVSTDIELSTMTILEYYSIRWSIETSFLYLKDRLGLKHYQMRKLKGLKRFWSIVYLAYTYIEVYRFRKSQEQQEFTLGHAIRSIKGVTFQDLIRFIHLKTVNNVALDELFKILKVAI
ncbi:Transposase DDE domain-containing protein [Natronincola ferrireducens]|uniref:Transposase DDE domain-containing protein n=1 Tax=Natronincola ferrireducens TaxID=393762 RepID=A0A1G9GZJ2_9FIRM|nr:Transposase DDE domain-containing protein [Natronincola ferrireducens]